MCYLIVKCIKRRRRKCYSLANEMKKKKWQMSLETVDNKINNLITGGIKNNTNNNCDV